MATDFLDLLGVVLSPQLSATETTRLRQMLDRRAPASEVPWASGVPDIRAQRDEARAEAEALRERVAWLELAFKLLCDMLTQARIVDNVLLRDKLCAIRDQVEVERKQRENTVICVTCGASVSRDEAHVRATGTLCRSCHLGASGRGQKLVEVRVETGHGYRDSPQTMLVEETVVCVSCATAIPVSASFNSSRGALCTKCQLEQSDE